MRLSELAPGSAFTVSRVLMGGEVGKRLADMGFTDGAEGELVRGAFLRGPVQVRIRGYDLLIRRGEARLIEVEEARSEVREGAASLAGDTAEELGRGVRRRGGRAFLRSMFAQPDCCRQGGERRARGRRA